ncbi:MAG: O-antigen ligase family protein [Bacteriovoracia bacterium]
MGKSALYLWCAGLAIVTFDLILTFEFGGFTIKSYYFLFLAAASLFALEEIRGGRVWDRARELFRRPWVFAFLLFAYELGMSPFSYVPKKSFAYSVWLLFDLVVVALPGYFLLSREIFTSRRVVTFALMAAAYFLVGILIVDLIAFQYGFLGGFIGYNQEPSLGWGMSRAHAFSFEPSYLSMYFNFSMLFLVGEVISPKPNIPRIPLFGSVILLLVGIFLLASRTGWLLVGTGLAVLLFHSRHLLRRKDLKKAALGIAAFVVLFLLLLPSKHYSLMGKHLISTILSGTDGSGNTRLKAMNEAAQISLETKGLGVGVGASFFYYLAKNPALITPHLHVTMGGESIMSTWGQIVAESGLPGTLLYFAFGLSIILALVRAARSSGDATVTASAVSAVLFFGLAAHLVGNLARTDVWVWFALWMSLTVKTESAHV